MSKKVIILGGKGIGMIASSIIDKTPDLDLIGFLNDFEPVGTEIGYYMTFGYLGYRCV